MSQAVYLDYAATTPVDPAVVDVMVRHLGPEGTFANPASRSHLYGWLAEEAVESARRQVADLLQADPREIVWTSGATEANNLAIKGVIEARGGGHVITSATEHKAVLDACGWLEAASKELHILFAATITRPITVDPITLPRQTLICNGVTVRMSSSPMPSRISAQSTSFFSFSVSVSSFKRRQRGGV